MKSGEFGKSITYKIFDIKTKRIMHKKVLKIEEDRKNNYKDHQNVMKEFEVLYHFNHLCICFSIKIYIYIYF